jgi:hypothetical protein
MVVQKKAGLRQSICKEGARLGTVARAHLRSSRELPPRAQVRESDDLKQSGRILPISGGLTGRIAMMDDLTLTEVIKDPLISLVLKADGIDNTAFANSLESARRRFIDQGLERLRQERADHFYRRLGPNVQ